MRIAIEATMAQRSQLTGFGHYVVNLLRALAAAAPENEYILMHTAEEWTGPDFGPQFRPVSYLSERSPLGLLFHLNKVLLKEGAELFHATCTTGAPPNPSIPCVSTIHDIYPILYPHEMLAPPSDFYKLMLKFAVESSRLFISNSDFTAREFASYYSIDPSKIMTAHLAPSMPPERLAPEGQRSKDSFILCAGAIERRKGQLMLAEGYARALEAGRRLPPLKFAGPNRGDAEGLLSFIEARRLKGRIEWIDYVSDEKMAELFRTASLFVFPSTYEGFGIPLVEAKASGLPAICSDIEVFHEIAGDYPVFAKPYPEAFGDAIAAFFDGKFDAHFRNAPRNAGSWAANASKTLEAYRLAIAKS